MNTTFLPRLFAAAGAAVLFAAATAAHADATLDRIKERKSVAIGVVINGGPFGSIDPATQRFVGWNPELARDIARQLGVDAELVQVQPSNRVQFLQSGKVDLLVASMEVTPERADILAYAPTPFYRVGGTAVVRKDSGIRRWEDLRGKTVCLSQGSNYAKPLQAEYGAQVKGFKSSSESLLALRGSNCVAAVHDATLVYPLLRTNPEWKDYAAPLPELIPSPSVVWARKGENDTVAAIDRIVQNWHRTGWLIALEKRLGIEPAQPLLPELQAKYKNAK
ncbi:transporter substrate-binding domain-containing protein [Xylophilus sp.]|uniref:transporter substrate-binding domain-containing protein n=1 Tax=Xylophilus sp. TaxID=2653893 RepID=UPI0013B765DE|nr:transporter substrate-binding domain-containing protein [Xylophilus sp.]KAF1044779.1 MAG: Arginine-binding extracellular protein ArtP [Xylophilus sp.]